jgi:hypothetical protein
MARPVAVKFFVRLRSLTVHTIRMYERETSIAAALHHPNIVRFHGVCVQPPSLVGGATALGTFICVLFCVAILLVLVTFICVLCILRTQT